MLTLDSVCVKHGVVTCRVNATTTRGSDVPLNLYEGPIVRALNNAVHHTFQITQESLEAAYKQFLLILEAHGHCGDLFADIIAYFRKLLHPEDLKPLMVSEVIEQKTFPPDLKHLLVPCSCVGRKCRADDQHPNMVEIFQKPKICVDRMVISIRSCDITLNRDSVLYYH